MSEVIKLDPFGAGEQDSWWNCYLTQDRRTTAEDQRIKLCVFADGTDEEPGVHEHEFPYELATAILAATHTQESRDKLWTLLEQVAEPEGSTATSSASGREQ